MNAWRTQIQLWFNKELNEYLGEIKKNHRAMVKDQGNGTAKLNADIVSGPKVSFSAVTIP